MRFGGDWTPQSSSENMTWFLGLPILAEILHTPWKFNSKSPWKFTVSPKRKPDRSSSSPIMANSGVEKQLAGKNFGGKNWETDFKGFSGLTKGFVNL